MFPAQLCLKLIPKLEKSIGLRSMSDQLLPLVSLKLNYKLSELQSDIKGNLGRNKKDPKDWTEGLTLEGNKRSNQAQKRRVSF